MNHGLQQGDVKREENERKRNVEEEGEKEEYETKEKREREREKEEKKNLTLANIVGAGLLALGWGIVLVNGGAGGREGREEGDGRRQ